MSYLLIYGRPHCVQIDPGDVAKKAQEVKSIGGIGTYNTFNHIDTRDRKADGSPYSWDERTK